MLLQPVQSASHSGQHEASFVKDLGLEEQELVVFQVIWRSEVEMAR